MPSITFQSVIDQHPTLRMHFITVPSDVVKEVRGIGTRLQCSVNEGEFFQCGMTALGGGNAYISLSKKRMKSFGVAKGETVKAAIKLDKSKYGFDIPEELQALLEQDREGFHLFEKLTDGQKRYIIYYVSQVKSSQKRIDRSILLINNLKTMPTKFSFRHLLGKPPREDEV